MCIDLDPLFVPSINGAPFSSNYAGTTLAHAAVTINPMCGSNTALTRLAP